MKKNKLLIALLIVLLFIPSYIGIASYISKTRMPVTLDQATELTITDLAGKTYTEQSDGEATKLFEQINKNAFKLDSTPDLLSSADYFKVTYTEGKRATEYRYFFTINANSAYYMDPNGDSYSIRSEDAAAFLETKYAQSLYEYAYVPTLHNGETLLVPASYEWAYATLQNKVLRSGLGDTTDQTITYTGKSGLELTFSREPATFNVTVKSADGETLYSGDYAGLAGAVDTKKHSALAIDIAAEWVATAEQMSSGSAAYSFLLNVEADTEFFLTLSASGADEGNSYIPFIPGDIAMITGISVSDPAKITCTITPALTHNGKEIHPIFFANGKNAYAFLPTAYDTAPGDYQVVLGYEGINYPLELHVEKKTFKTNVYDVGKDVLAATRTEATLASYEALVADIIDGDFSTAYFDEAIFNTGVTDQEGNTVKVGYGRTQTITSSKEKFVLEGVEYYAKEGSPILAAMNGKVLHTTTTAYTGTMVAIDHGYGLISWYHNLSSVSVKAGDIVTTGQEIAKSGSTGFTQGGLAYVALTVYDVPVCAYDFIWGSGIRFH